MVYAAEYISHSVPQFNSGLIQVIDSELSKAIGAFEHQASPSKTKARTGAPATSCDRCTYKSLHGAASNGSMFLKMTDVVCSIVLILGYFKYGTMFFRLGGIVVGSCPIPCRCTSSRKALEKDPFNKDLNVQQTHTHLETGSSLRVELSNQSKSGMKLL